MQDRKDTRPIKLAPLVFKGCFPEQVDEKANPGSTGKRPLKQRWS